MARYIPLFYRGSPASIPQVVAHIQRTLTEEDPGYTPLRQRMPPASIPEIVAHIQEYLTENVFVTVEDLGDSIAQYIEDHPDIVGVLTVNGSSGNVALDASDIPIETGEDPTVAGAISYLSSQLALLVADAVMSVNGVTPDDSHNVTLTGANIAQDGTTTKKLSETFGPATASTAGSKGLVPAPAAGDEDKVLSGAGTWVVNQSAGGVSSVCGVSPNAQGNVPLKGSDIPLQSMSLQTVSQAIAAASTVFTGATSSASGAKGQVPAPAAGDEYKVLSGSGTWVTPTTGTVKQVCSVSPDAQGNVALTGSAVPTSSTDNTPIATSLSSLNDQITNLGNAIAKVCNGATAPAGGIPAKSFYYHNGILYYTESLIAQGTTLPQGTAVPNGGLNSVYDSAIYKTYTQPTQDQLFSSLTNVSAVNYSSIPKTTTLQAIMFQFTVSANITSWTNFMTLNAQYRPAQNSVGLIFASDGSGASIIFVGANGNITTGLALTSGKSYIVYFLY